MEKKYNVLIITTYKMPMVLDLNKFNLSPFMLISLSRPKDNHPISYCPYMVMVTTSTTLSLMIDKFTKKKKKKKKKVHSPVVQNLVFYFI